MLRMVSYSHRPKSGQITCYLNRTYHVLTTVTPDDLLDNRRAGWYSELPKAGKIATALG
jgi:hypothetical protein